MAYGDFTLESAREAFDLKLAEHANLFGKATEIAPSEWLTTFMAGSVPLARAVNTEKARSEWMIAPVLAEIKLRYGERCSLFSGVEFNVDVAKGLRGYCDFILSRSPLQHLLTAPAIMVAESKNVDLASGYGQCIAGMVAARIFNEQKGAPLPVIYGVISTGDQWGFLQLIGDRVTLDMKVYSIDGVGKILGILAMIVAG